MKFLNEFKSRRSSLVLAVAAVLSSMTGYALPLPEWRFESAINAESLGIPGTLLRKVDNMALCHQRSVDYLFLAAKESGAILVLRSGRDTSEWSLHQVFVGSRSYGSTDDSRYRVNHIDLLSSPTGIELAEDCSRFMVTNSDSTGRHSNTLLFTQALGESVFWSLSPSLVDQSVIEDTGPHRKIADLSGPEGLAVDFQTGQAVVGAFASSSLHLLNINSTSEGQITSLQRPFTFAFQNAETAGLNGINRVVKADQHIYTFSPLSGRIQHYQLNDQRLAYTNSYTARSQSLQRPVAVEWTGVLNRQLLVADRDLQSVVIFNQRENGSVEEAQVVSDIDRPVDMVLSHNKQSAYLITDSAPYIRGLAANSEKHWLKQSAGVLGITDLGLYTELPRSVELSRQGGTLVIAGRRNDAMDDTLVFYSRIVDVMDEGDSPEDKHSPSYVNPSYYIVPLSILTIVGMTVVGSIVEYKKGCINSNFCGSHRGLLQINNLNIKYSP
ncbi:hypothetical protein EOPP23_17390 [Endozoicomonas sp. OPT23]|uniref:hypothetical protein n=1 Tax=Endozoicomonas sp. OPT23 TaxID=2072845 RepID=UPI00129B09DB|nr:hypothetical protein [Endozoicomonas sp. OPT23]MRI34758.1 hypothetical protein [Endozoicomonas sp. OPT23]